MKISQMTTEQAADVIVRIAEPAGCMMRDENMLALVERIANTDDNNPFNFIGNNLSAIVYALLKDNRYNLFEVVAALNGKTREEVAQQKITATIQDIYDSLDRDLLDFFGTLRKSPKKKSTK